METVLNQSAPCPHCVVTDHGSRRGRASRTVRRARETRRNVANQCQIVPPFVGPKSPPERDDRRLGGSRWRGLEITRFRCDSLAHLRSFPPEGEADWPIEGGSTARSGRVSIGARQWRESIALTPDLTSETSHDPDLQQPQEETEPSRLLAQRRLGLTMTVVSAG